MSLRGFGLTFTNGVARNWYVGADGVQRWADTDAPVKKDNAYYANVKPEDREPPCEVSLFDDIPDPVNPYEVG